MFYNKILAKGSTYFNDAGMNWTRRKDKLMRVWCRMQSNEINGDGGRIQRVYKLTTDLEERIRGMIEEHYKRQRLLSLQASEGGEMDIAFQCEKISCLMNPNNCGVSIKFKDYSPDKDFFCNTCGSRMELKEGSSIMSMLMCAGIHVL
jgi:hypothetical protein